MHKLVELSLELTNSCPLQCVHCSSGSSPKRLPNELYYEDHVRLLYEARELGATVLSLSGGSPLNYDPIVDYETCERGGSEALIRLIGLAIEMGFEKVLVYTTGHSIYGDCIYRFPDFERLIGIEQLTWIFSAHSHNRPTNDYIMNRTGALKDITTSIQALTARGERVEVHMVPMKPSFRDIPGMRDFCGTLGVKKMSCLRFVPQTRGKANKDMLGMDVSEFVEMQLILHREMEKNGQHDVELRLGCPIDFRHTIGLLPEKAKPCHAGDDLILVRPDGAVHPCAAWKTLPADDSVKFWDSRNDVMATIPLHHIWESSIVFNSIREFKRKIGLEGVGDGQYLIGGACVSCALLSSCLTGCPAQRLHAIAAKDIVELYDASSDPLCPRGQLY